MIDHIVKSICRNVFGTVPRHITRCAIGHGNYVYSVNYAEDTYIVRCSPQKGAYAMTVHWLTILSGLEAPIPKIIDKGHLNGLDYLILTYIDGTDIGEVYAQLTSDEKKQIAKEIVAIQNKVSSLNISTNKNWMWKQVICELLDRAEDRIIQNGFFDAGKVQLLRQELGTLEHYFSTIEPRPYLDDISTKNLLIHHGRISGIVDIDELGFGDKLTYVALTYMALLNDGQDTDYVDAILAEMDLSADERNAFLFYALVYCVDFMGERGMCFMDKQIPVSPQIIDRLNRIYGSLWSEWKGQVYHA